MGVEGAVRVLEDHLDAAPQRSQSPLREGGDVRAVEDDTAGSWGEQPDQGTGEGRLAAAGLADDRERAALVQLEADLVDGAEGAARGRVFDDQVLYGEQGHGVAPRTEVSSSSQAPRRGTAARRARV